MRFFLSALLACILVTHASAQLPYAIFEDVPASKPYYDQVNLLRERLVTQGCSVHPAQYCPDLPYALSRGQAAVLIIRSIYSARTGDPEGFTYPSTPYFTDVPADHEQFKYIQKMKELGITSGYTATTYEPWGTLNFGQIAVFSHRARQVRLWQPVSAPYPCSYAPFPDVPSDYPFCPYIRDMASELGNDKAISPNCWTGFCPESIPMSRGALAFYLANGVMNVGQPQWLPRRQDANTYQWERITLPEPSLDTKVPQSSGYTTNDSPGVRLPNGYQEVAVNASFSLWLMYRPFAANSIFVPVHRIDWHYGGRALLAGAVWSLDNPTYSNPPAIQPDPNYPEWTKNAANYITPQNWVVEQ